MRSTARLTDAPRSRRAVTLVGAAAALLGAGTATAATATAATASAATVPAAAHHVPAVSPVDATLTAAIMAAPQPGGGLAAVSRRAAAPSPHVAGRTGDVRRGSAKPAAPSAKPAAPEARKAASWSQIEQSIAKQTGSREPRAADLLQPVATSGTQAWMPVSSDQLANATTIVKQALAKKMGLRSAVVAVATSMQEAQLQNIDYGTSDSLGLFQQQPDMGWGTAQQVMNPAYAAGAFLSALQRYQGSNPAWADQPLWQAAQGVQHSAFPLAYAKWETQAAHLVKQIATNVK